MHAEKSRTLRGGQAAAHLHAADFEAEGGLRGLLVLYLAALDVGGVRVGVPRLVAHLQPSHMRSLGHTQILEHSSPTENILGRFPWLPTWETDFSSCPTEAHINWNLVQLGPCHITWRNTRSNLDVYDAGPPVVLRHILKLH